MEQLSHASGCQQAKQQCKLEAENAPHDVTRRIAWSYWQVTYQVRLVVESTSHHQVTGRVVTVVVPRYD